MHLDRLTLKRDALGFIETLENVYQSTRRAIPETLNFHQHCRENHRSHNGTMFEGIFNFQYSSRNNHSYILVNDQLVGLFIILCVVMVPCLH
jgi:hypothetical protein